MKLLKKLSKDLLMLPMRPFIEFGGLASIPYER